MFDSLSVANTYATLTRLTGVTFGDTTPALGYLYDDITNGNAGKGRLTKLTDATGLTEYTYDIQGRLLQKKQTTGIGVNMKCTPPATATTPATAA